MCCEETTEVIKKTADNDIMNKELNVVCIFFMFLGTRFVK